MDGAFTFAQALSVGPDNLLWGALARWIGPWPFVGSHRIAVTPFVTLCILASLALAARRRLWIWMDSELSRRVVLAAGLTCILLVLFTVRVGGLSVFAVLQVVVPGARAIRLAERVLVVVNFFGAVAIAVTLARLTGKRSGEGNKQWHWRAGLAGLLFALLMFEQVNSGRNASVSRAAEAAHFSAVRPPPPECRAFFVTPQRALSASENQTDAMMVVHRVGLPTLNGTTGINPPSHPLADVFAPDYQQRAVAWAAGRDTLDWLCRLDIPTGEWLHWSKLDGAPRLGPGETIALNHSGDWSSVLIKGWSRPEEGSVWSDGPEAKLLLPIAQSGDREATLEFNAHAFVAQRHPEVTVTVAVSGETLAVWRFTREAWTQTLLLEVPRHLVSPIGLLLSFQIATPESPRRLGLHDDGRLLGLGLRSIRVIH
jgi:hypothetical protein